MSLILKSKAVKDIPVHVRDLVEVHTKKQHEKRGKWSVPKPILSVDADARTITVPGRAGKTLSIAIEDIRLASAHDSLEQMVQDGIDCIDDLLRERITQGPVGSQESSASDGTNTTAVTPDIDSDFSTEGHNVEASVGDSVAVYWPEDDQYYTGTVHSAEPDGRLNVHYDDGEKECLDMSAETWKLTTTVSANSGTTSSRTSLLSTEKDVLTSMLQNFGNKPFLKHEAQGFDQFPLFNSYRTEEESFMKTVRPVPIQDVPQYGNIISSHTLYKVKRSDDGSLLLKARIAPHGNEDDLKNVLSKDCSTCPPTGLRIVESIAAIKGWTIYKADVKAAFLQTGEAHRDVYVRPPRDSKMKSTYLWLLLTAAYGLVNANKCTLCLWIICSLRRD